MFLPPFTYCSPSSLDEALEILSNSKERAEPLAGGTDILVEMKEGRRSPLKLMSLKNVRELHKIAITTDTISIGAALTVSELDELELSLSNPVIHDVIRGLANLQIRNRATIGGNLCTAAACADFPPALLVNDAKVKLASQNGGRELPLREFITGPRETIIKHDELLKSISFKRKNVGSAYVKFGLRKASNISIVGVAGSLELKRGTIENLSVAITAASPIPVFLDDLSKQFRGSTPTLEIWQKVADLVGGALNPISDIRGSSEYRRHLAKVGTVRALEMSYSRWEEFNGV